MKSKINASSASWKRIDKKGGENIMRYQKPELTKVESAITVIQSMTKIAPPTPDSEQRLTVAAYQADE